MGVFDNIYVAPPLPVKLPHGKDPRMIDWQTKDLPDPWCRTFRLTWEGRLEQMACEPDARDRPEIWSSKGWVDANHLLEDGYDSIDFYDLSDDESGISWWTEFRAVFESHKLVRIEHVDTHESGPEAYRRRSLVSEIERRSFEADRLRRLSTMTTEARVRCEARRLMSIEARHAFERDLASAIYGQSERFKKWAGIADALPILFKGSPTATNPRRIPWPWEKTDG